ncbi:Protein SPA2 [Nakaseomyces bracarensis]|uniref:Protein SPA2 n=1 Tax=Nakaseomyces bracarensis TaxID=273131 RepID=A0ABR4NYP0_9SACH
MSELSESQQQDVYQYYISLKTFFEATDSNKDRSSSSRAQKARAKLLKLSPSQFYELSTDVSDELNRRIDEDQDQPEYLLPKASFHVKRNQARQKLAKLSQTRFNDLIDDILYEIYRRGYDKSQPSKNDSSMHEIPADVHREDKNSIKIQEEVDHLPKQLEGNDEQANNDTTTSSSVQPLLVLPKKASIDWSSDEEETNDKVEREVGELAEVETKSKDISNMIESTFQKAADIQEMEYKESPKPKSESDLNTTPDLNQVIQSEFNSTDQVYESNNISFEYDQPQDTYSTTNDFQSLYKSAEDISEIQDDKDEDNELANKATDTLHSSTSVEERYQKDFIQLNSEIRDLSIENEHLKQRISELEIEIKSPSKAKRNESNLQPMDTKRVLKKLMDENILNDFKTLESYFDSNGYISVDVVENIRENVNQIYAIIYDNYNSKKDNFDINGRQLFKHMAHISDSVAKVLNMVDFPEFNDQSVILKAAISHAITTLRYYTTYGPLIPVITLLASITEVLFSFCSLIKIAKIKLDEKKSLFGEIADSNSNKSFKNETIPTFPSTPVVAEKKTSTPFFEKPKDVDGFLDQNDESPVKPLKITQKAINSPKLTPATSSRKPSGTGLFSLKIDTKSVDALSKLNETSHEKDSDITPSKKKPEIQENPSKSNDLEIISPKKDDEEKASKSSGMDVQAPKKDIHNPQEVIDSNNNTIHEVITKDVLETSPIRTDVLHNKISSDLKELDHNQESKNHKLILTRMKTYKKIKMNLIFILQNKMAFLYLEPLKGRL